MPKRLGSLSAVTTVVLLVLTSPASAATITPNVLTDELNAANTNCSLREAVSIANADATTAEPDCAITNGGLGDDTISLGSNTYVLSLTGPVENSNNSGDLDVLSTGGDLTIDGAGATQTTVGTVGAPTWNDRVLHQVAGAGALVVSDLTLSGGNDSGGTGGGGILSSLTSNGSLTVQGARVTGNDTTGEGGGISVGSGGTSNSLSILGSAVDGNSASGAAGGGGVITNVPTTIDSSLISGNDATRPGPRGGGILANGSGNAATITDSVISGNTAESTDTGQPLGGGISAENGSVVTVARTTVSGNKVVGGSGSFGGGINALGAATTVTVVNSTVSGNEALSAGGQGGGLRTNGSTATIVHSTFGPNPVDPVSNFGSALVRSSGAINIRGSVVETSGAATACEPGAGFITSQGFNVFTDNSCPFVLGPGDQPDADPMLGPLQDNGGPDVGAPGLLQPLLTILPAQTSTVVDHVPAASCDDETAGAPLLLVDQRGAGFPRPFDGDGNGTADCDAGSVELQTAPAPPPPPATGNTPPAAGSAQPAAKKKCKKAKKRAASAKKCKKRK